MLYCVIMEYISNAVKYLGVRKPVTYTLNMLSSQFTLITRIYTVGCNTDQFFHPLNSLVATRNLGLILLSKI